MGTAETGGIVDADCPEVVFATGLTATSGLDDEAAISGAVGVGIVLSAT